MRFAGISGTPSKSFRAAGCAIHGSAALRCCLPCTAESNSALRPQFGRSGASPYQVSLSALTALSRLSMLPHQQPKTFLL